MKSIWPQKPPAGTWKGLLQIFLLCAGAGGFFGLLVLSSGYLPGGIKPGTAVFHLPLIAIIAGAAGTAGAALDIFLERARVRHPLFRRLIPVAGAISIPVIFLILFGTRLYPGVTFFQDRIIAVMILGFLFGLFIYTAAIGYDRLGKKIHELTLRNKLLMELAEKNRLLEEAVRSLAVTEERNRMARELHDSISQGIHGVIYSGHSLRRYFERQGISGKALFILDHLLRTAETTLGELRAMFQELRPSLLQDKGLPEALRRHCALFSERQKISVRLSLRYAGGLSPAQEIAVYRIVQEALANIEKHAGAREVAVGLVAAGDRVKLVVRDDGRGFDPERVEKGHGLENMTARARENNGSLVIEAAEGRGSIISAEFTRSRQAGG